MISNYWGPQVTLKAPSNNGLERTKYRLSLCHAMVSGNVMSRDSNNNDDTQQSRAIRLHAFSDLSHVSPAMFVYLLKECYAHGTQKATFKFRVLQQQVLQALYNEPQAGPAVFIIQCLYLLPLLGSPYTEGFSHLLISSYRRFKVKENMPNSSESKHLAAKLFINILAHCVCHEERILMKLLEVFEINLEDIGEVICSSSINHDHLDAAKTHVAYYIYTFIESQSYMTAITLLEHFSIYESAESGSAFLNKMVRDNQFKAAEKWAAVMGRSVICLLIEKYVERNMLKNAYDMIMANDLEQEFADICQLHEASVLKKLADEGILQSPVSCQSFLDTMIQNKQFKAAEKWAVLMGKPMICLLIKKYAGMDMIKNAYDMIKANGLKDDFLDIYHLYKQSLLKKLSEKGCWDVAEMKTNNDKQLLDYLVFLAMETGYTEKVDELIERYSLSGFDDIKERDACALSSNYLNIKEFTAEGVTWIDELDQLLDATTYLEDCKVVGMDCEWKPNYVKGSKPNRVSIIQVASEERVFIFDLIKLYDDESVTLNNCFKRILHSPNILKLGYNFQCDLHQLSRSYGDLECFKYYNMLLDIQKLFNEPKGGLSGLAEKLLGAGLNKTRRNSDWERRPLTQNQIEYAALDAAVLIRIFQQIDSHSHSVSFEDGKVNKWRSRIDSRMGNARKRVYGAIIPSKEDEDLQIEVNVLFFARARDLTGLSNMSLKVPNNSTANDCMSKLLATFPRLEEICDSMLLAINEEYAVESTVLKEGDEFAIIPPLSGG